jgi:hypothetical protein
MGGFTPFTVGEIEAADAAMKHWSDVANVTLTRVGSGTSGSQAYSDNADILLGNFTGNSSVVSTYDGYGSWRWSVNNGVYTRNSQVWLDGTQNYIVNASFGNNAYRLAIHEIGHALALSHPSDYDVSQGTPTYDNSASFREDDGQYTVMSYFSETSTGANFGGQRALTPMLYDIASVQRLYGANLSTRTGNTTYGFNNNTGDQVYSFTSTFTPVFCIWDAGGSDTIDASGYATDSLIDLRPGAFSDIGRGADGSFMKGNVSIAYNVTIENAKGGAGSDTLIGNDTANVLTGNGSGTSGYDTFYGNGGNDTFLIAGGGTVSGGSQFDTAIFQVARASATVSRSGLTTTVTMSSGTTTLTGVEKLQFTDKAMAIALPRGDVTGDGKSELLFQNASTGDVAFWTLNNGAYGGYGSIGNASGYTVAGVGDVTGDGTSDLVFQATDGSVANWTLQNGAYSTYANVGNAGSYKVVGVADVNADATSDLIFQDGTGQVADWVMQNGQYAGYNAIGDAGTYKVVGTGDFNSDGTSDLVFQSASGQVAIWTLANGRFASYGNVGDAGAYRVTGVGDFNGDGTSDLLFQNAGGQVAAWTIQNASYAGYSNLGNASGYSVAAVGDFNADGTSDIAFQNTSGQVADWTIRNSQFYAYNNVGAAGSYKLV